MAGCLPGKVLWSCLGLFCWASKTRKFSWFQKAVSLFWILGCWAAWAGPRALYLWSWMNWKLSMWPVLYTMYSILAFQYIIIAYNYLTCYYFLSLVLLSLALLYTVITLLLSLIMSFTIIYDWKFGCYTDIVPLLHIITSFIITNHNIFCFTLLIHYYYLLWHTQYYL